MLGLSKTDEFCPFNPQRTGGITTSLGWMDQLGGTTFRLRGPDGQGGDEERLGFEYSASGVYIGGAATLKPRPRLGLIVNGAYLIPTSEPPATEASSSGASQGAWRASTGWWNIGGAAVWQLTDPCWLVVGVRYDSWSTVFRADSGESRLPVSADRGAQPGLRMNSLIPFMGLTAVYGSGAWDAAFGIIGSPTVSGRATRRSKTARTDDAKFNIVGDYSGGYFVEALAELSLAVGPGRAGVFLAGSLLSVSGVGAVTGSTAAAGSGPYTFTFDRPAVVIGAKYSINFALP